MKPSEWISKRLAKGGTAGWYDRIIAIEAFLDRMFMSLPTGVEADAEKDHNDPKADPDEALKEAARSAEKDHNDPKPKSGLPNYHEILALLCDEFHIPGSPSLWDVIAKLKKSLGEPDSISIDKITKQLVFNDKVVRVIIDGNTTDTRIEKLADEFISKVGGAPEPLTIRELVRDSYDRAKRKGFYDPIPSIESRLLLIVSEAVEALEDYRDDRMVTIFEGSTKPVGLPSELADIVIRVCDFAGHLGIDLEKEIKQKAAYNETRPVKHGRVRL